MENFIKELKKYIEENSFIIEQDFITNIIIPNNDKVIYIDDLYDKIKELENMY